jgi:molybdopterin-biosynthesis enzyme MoeA-like protein
VARWAELPRGSRPLENPLGGAPGFQIENAWVLPGLPSEMKAMFDRYAEELRADRPIGSWRRRYRTRESIISPALVGATARWPEVLVGSYPSFGDDGPEVEVVLKSSDSDALEAARTWLEAELDRLT